MDTPSDASHDPSRRDFLKTAAALGVGAAVTQSCATGARGVRRRRRAGDDARRVLPRPRGPLGHGGMDLLEDWRLVACLRGGLPTDMNVYDAAMLSCICELTERSVASRSSTQAIPDFTRGRWRTTPPLGIVEA